MKTKKILKKVAKYQKKMILIDLVTYPKRFYCEMSAPDNWTPTKQRTDHHKTPKKALKAALKIAKKMYDGNI